MRYTRLNRRPAGKDEAASTASPAARESLPFEDAMSLQGTIGNAAVGQLLNARQRALHEAPTPVDAGTQTLIAGQAGSGEAMSAPLAAEMQNVVGGPVPGVHIHRGPESDSLARMLGATAFTQGRDVFLRSDRDPASAPGRATLAHELAHVAQGSIGPGAVLREPAPDVQEAEPLDSSEKTNTSSVVAKITLENGDVMGESTVPGHKGEVDFASLSFASVRSPGSDIGSSREGPESKVVELVGSRKTDKATTALFEASAKGIRIASATFYFVKVVGKDIVEEVMTLDFQDGYITSYSISGDFESLSFSFSK